MPMPETLAELVSLIHQRNPSLANKERATLVAVNTFSNASVSMVEQARDAVVVAIEQEFAGAVAEFIDPQTVKGQPNEKARLDAIFEAMDTAAQGGNGSARAGVNSKAVRMLALYSLYQSNGTSISDPAFGQPTRMVPQTTLTLWIDAHNAGKPVTMAQLIEAWPQ